MQPLRTSERNVKLIATILAHEQAVKDGMARIDWNVADQFSLKDYTEANVVAFGPELADPISTISLSLVRMMDEMGIDSRELVARIALGLPSDVFSAEQIDRFKVLFTSLISQFSLNKVKVLDKASDIYFSTNHHFHSFKILTNLKPIFSLDRSQIVNFIVTSQIHMIISDGIERDIEYIIDVGIDDLKKIGEHAESALKKVQVAEAQMSKLIERKVVTYNP
ncbi:hypothetical protein [Bosea sp. R86505]|uniref:hypothetical protein n=1 Tax=Bosea sp. R86505 TaxID=3101710 RepID=UPI00366E70AB